MKWREHLALLLGAASPFALIGEPVLAAPAPMEEGASADPPQVQKDLLVFRDPAERQRLLLFAGHRSHSSHSSHRSHSSHYSGSSGHSSHSSHYSSSGASATPAPLYSPPVATAVPKAAPAKRKKPKASVSARPAAATRSVTPSTPVPAPITPSMGFVGAPESPPPPRQRLTADEITDMVRKVQVALTIRGYKVGAATGAFNAKTQSALSAFQGAQGLSATGAMDLATLQALGVDLAMPSNRAHVITRPDWISKPSGEDFARVYPDLAQRVGLGGRATLRCTVDSSGRLTNCSIVSEAPDGYGFGAAALKLASLFQMRLRTLDGAAVEGGEITLPLTFNIPN